jgi:deazaflavin-dependent oxidoreductase (nitroreductase family)
MPLAGKRWNPLFAVIEHRGRRSGRVYSTPVAARHTSGGFVVALAFGTHVDWYRNLRATGGGTIRWCGQLYPVTAPVPVAASQAIEAFNVVQRLAMRVARIDSFILLPDASASPE